MDASDVPAEAGSAAPALLAIPRGIAESQRPWKTLRVKRTSAYTKGVFSAVPPKGVRSGSFNAAMAKKRARQQARDIGLRLREELQAEKAAKRERRMENERRRTENALKSTQYTEVTDSRKLKKMNKRQLMQLQKTKTDAYGNTVLVPAFGKGSTGGGRGKQVSTFRKR